MSTLKVKVAPGAIEAFARMEDDSQHWVGPLTGLAINRKGDLYCTFGPSQTPATGLMVSALIRWGEEWMFGKMPGPVRLNGDFLTVEQWVRVSAAGVETVGVTTLEKDVH